ncbi:MAG: hypothetical protein WB810_03115 [Candidatus Cybelea sp.]
MPADEECSTSLMVDAYAIWLHARAAVTAAQYPERLDYTIAISGLDGASPAADHYRASCDPSGSSVRLFPISDEQLAAPPPVPRGINTNFVISISGGQGSGTGTYTIPMGHPPAANDLLGEPLLQPTYMFGIRYAAEYGHKPQAPDDTTLRTIAVVSSGSPIYRVSLVDEPTIDGVVTYHLTLTPLRKPKENRLRELWVGADDYLPRRAVTDASDTVRDLIESVITEKLLLRLPAIA